MCVCALKRNRRYMCCSSAICKWYSRQGRIVGKGEIFVVVLIYFLLFFLLENAENFQQFVRMFCLLQFGQFSTLHLWSSFLWHSFSILVAALILAVSWNNSCRLHNMLHCDNFFEDYEAESGRRWVFNIHI